jgi:cytochrome c nitrite reductase small subunit
MRGLYAIFLGIPIGLAAGIGGYTFVYAKGGSYLTNDPAACANCHVMQEQYDGWIKSSHRAVAVCNDCHTPHDIVGKYGTKVSNGWHHSFAFTTGRFPDQIRITPRNRAITEHTCRHCHQEIVQAIEGPHRDAAEELSCLRCHGSVGHAH